MPHIPQNMNDAVEMGTIPEGRYRLRLERTSDLQADEEEPEKKYIDWTFVVAEGEFEGKQIRHRTYVALADPGKAAVARGMANLLLEALGIEYDESGFSTEDGYGEEVRAVVSTQESTKTQGREYNSIDTFIKA